MFDHTALFRGTCRQGSGVEALLQREMERREEVTPEEFKVAYLMRSTTSA
jgi:hypothetical protein